MTPFLWPVRIYWEDTDAGGIVYYANYLKFLERARTEWLRARGVEQAQLQREQGLIFVVVDIEAHYRKPARYSDLLQVMTRIETHTRTTLTFAQHIYRESHDSDLLLESRVRVACLDSYKHKPRPLPQIVLEEMRQ